MYLGMVHGFVSHLSIIRLNTNCFVELHNKTTSINLMIAVNVERQSI